MIGYSKFKEFFENERDLFEEYAGENVYNDFLEGLSLHSFSSIVEFNEYMMIEKLKVRVRRHLD